LEEERRTGPRKEWTGLVLETRGVMRNHQAVYIVDNDGVDIAQGEITSGSFSPTLGYSIAFARLPRLAPDQQQAEGNRLQVDIRGKRTDVKKVRLPFVRNGKKVY